MDHCLSLVRRPVTFYVGPKACMTSRFRAWPIHQQARLLPITVQDVVKLEGTTLQEAKNPDQLLMDRLGTLTRGVLGANQSRVYIEFESQSGTRRCDIRSRRPHNAFPDWSDAAAGVYALAFGRSKLVPPWFMGTSASQERSAGLAAKGCHP
jgi:hypothetical protein